MAKKKSETKGKHAAHAAQPDKTVWQKAIGSDSPEEETASAAAFAGASKTSSWTAKSWRKNGDSAFSQDNEGQGSHAPVKPGDYAATTDAAIGDFKDKRAKRKRLKKGFAIVGGIVVGLILAVYIGGCIFFSSHFLPNSTLGSYDVSLMSTSDAASALDKASGDYTLTVSGEGLNFTLSSVDTGLNVDSSSIVQQAIGAYPLWQWPYRIFFDHDLSSSIEASYNQNGLGQTVRTKVDEFNKTATQPANATIAFDAKSNGFKVATEQQGTALDADAVVNSVEEAAFRMESVCAITSDELKKPAVTADNPKLATAATSANKLLGADLTLMLSTTKVAEVNSETISKWVVLDADLNPTLSSDAMTAWVDKLATDCDTVGTERTYTRPNGVTVTVSGGTYGWEIDHDALITAVTDGVKAAEVKTVDIPCTQTAAVYNGVGGVDFGTRYVDIDLTNQHAVFYDNGKVIWETDVITGKPDGEHNTPQGVYMVNSKTSPQKLVGQMTSAGKPEYISTVQYWMPFIGNYIGMHDATWQPSFGGTMYADGYGSHGCVNLSYSAAQDLYGIISVGDVVITHF